MIPVQKIFKQVKNVTNDEPPVVLTSNSRGYAPLLKVVPFDDQFDVLLNPAPTSSNPNPSQTTIAKATINTSTWIPINGINFPGGDNTTFQTGFTSRSFDLTPFQGQEIDLLFRVFDRGDAAFTTAVLIDNIQITTI